MDNLWFKQLSFYLLNKDNLPDLDTLADKLNDTAFKPCMGLDWDSIGFASPVSFSPEMVFLAQNTWRIALKKEEKVLPAAVVRDILDEKINEIREIEGRYVGHKEKMELKETITDDLLSRAFTKSGKTEAIIDTQHGLLLINQANSNRAEMLLTKLRQALGGLEAKLPRTQQSPGSLMTEWLLNGAAAGNFELDSDCELKGSGDAAPVVRISRQELPAEEVINLVKNGKVATQLGLCWKDDVRFVLTQDFTLKRIQFLDNVQLLTKQYYDEPSLAEATQLLMTQILAELVSELVQHLGGWVSE